MVRIMKKDGNRFEGIGFGFQWVRYIECHEYAWDVQG